MHFRTLRFAPVAGAALLLVVSTFGPALSAAELTVISGGAIEPGLKAAAAAFEKETGHKIAITFNT
ncbi:MAG: hypothetical protein VW338_14130, partial [Rhodospirillaceae bacterium]